LSSGRSETQTPDHSRFVKYRPVALRKPSRSIFSVFCRSMKERQPLLIRVHAALRLRLAASDPKRTFRSPKSMSEFG
jgi:hypothetical protein